MSKLVIMIWKFAFDVFVRTFFFLHISLRRLSALIEMNGIKLYQSIGVSDDYSYNGEKRERKNVIRESRYVIECIII